MDNFMDKLAQKWNAAELIKANSTAETMELKRLREQVSEYETILQEMRKLNLKNTELNDSSRHLVEEGIKELTSIIEEEKKTPAVDVEQLVKETNQETQDFIHAENVKVYRNVQAVVVEGFQTQSEARIKQTDELGEKSSLLVKAVRGIKPLLIIILILLLANLGLMSAWIIGIL